MIDKVVAGIDAGEVNQASDLQITLSADERRSMLSYIIRPFNFLKHARRDPLATLEESDLDPEGAIIHALTAFSMVSPNKALPDQVAPFLDRHGLS